jgi:Rad3-related DNA helicase
LPYLIGRKHYRKKAYEDMVTRSEDAKILVMNPSSYHHCKTLEGFEWLKCASLIIDEADASLGVFKLQIGKTIPYYRSTACLGDVIQAMKEASYEEEAIQDIVSRQSYIYWRVEENVSANPKAPPYVIRVSDLKFSPYYFNKNGRITLMSGTLFPEDVRELVGEELPLYEADSPIASERRRVVGFTDDGESFVYPSDKKELADLLECVLRRFEDRPAIVHTTYGSVQDLLTYLNIPVDSYLDKELKSEALIAVEATDKVILASGAQIGLDLKYDKCRLNILLNGFKPNIKDTYVEKRLALNGGREWYIQQTLRLIIQACGRSTRAVDDFSTIVICDGKVLDLITRFKGILPKYFTNSCSWLKKA